MDVPERLRNRPRDERGFVIPFANFVDNKGVPDFRVIDDEKNRNCLINRLCGMCGVPMGRHIYFIGGPKCVESGMFYDPPMHRDCAIFALRSCPHLARSKGRYADTAPRNDTTGIKLAVGAMDVSKKAEWFGLMQTTAYTSQRMGNGMILIKAKLPWVSVERWRDGEPVK